jgi:hypothetical protein
MVDRGIDLFFHVCYLVSYTLMVTVMSVQKSA